MTRHRVPCCARDPASTRSVRPSAPPPGADPRRAAAVALLASAAPGLAQMGDRRSPVARPDAPTPTPVSSHALVDAAVADGGQLLRVDLNIAGPCDELDPRDCLLPFPNDRFTVADGSTDTGRRVQLDPRSMPRTSPASPSTRRSGTATTASRQHPGPHVRPRARPRPHLGHPDRPHHRHRPLHARRRPDRPARRHHRPAPPVLVGARPPRRDHRQLAPPPAPTRCAAHRGAPLRRGSPPDRATGPGT